jgi:beta-1,4-N-acetylglucosaminyltransferase
MYSSEFSFRLIPLIPIAFYSSSLLMISTLSSLPPLLQFVTFLFLFYFTRLIYLLLSIFIRRFHLSQSPLLQSPNHTTSFSPSAFSLSSLTPVRTLIVLGSGGHTGELLLLLNFVDFSLFSPRLYVRAETDKSSESRVKALEATKNSAAPAAYYVIPRSREVGQSYVSSCFSTIRALISSALLFARLQPEILLCNGPGTCLPLIFLAFFFRLFFFRSCRVVFIESFCRVETLSLCGLLAYPMVDRFIVQWKTLKNKYKLVEFIGQLC